MTTALILAAGRGSRVGGPKALLEIDGRPLASLHVARRLAAESDRAIVVVRADVARALRDHLDPRAIVVVSEAPDALGPAGSIAAAAAAGVLDGDLIVTPVDVLPAPGEATEPLLAALGTHEAARWARGHPIAIRARALVSRYCGAASPLRDVLGSLGAACAVLPVPASLALGGDLDTPEDVARVTGAPPRFFV